MERFLNRPNLIIYLKASTDTLVSRIKSRNRNFEKTISLDYLHRLNIGYDQWIKETNLNTLIIDTNNFNVFKDEKKLNQYFSQIKESLEKK